MINANIVAGKYTDKKGKVQIYLQVSVNRKVKRYKLFKAVPDDFDNDRQMMKKGHNRENLIISQVIAKIEEINLSSPNITLLEFEHLYNKKNNSSVSILNYAEATLAVLAVKTLLKIFPDATFSNIGNREAEIWLKQTLQTHTKLTVSTYLSYLRNVFSKAVKEGIIKTNPFKEIRYPKAEAHREYLTMEELDRIETATIDQKLQPYRDMFLMECYTGLRMSDIKSLEWDDITEGAIIKRMVKTGTDVFIPLSKKAANIIGRQPRTDSIIFQRCATSIPNINNHIREICRIAGITKKITSHCGIRSPSSR